MRMRVRWPTFEPKWFNSTTVCWTGPLRGFQKQYIVAIAWDSSSIEKPFVFLVSPVLRPREGESFEGIPHLIFDANNPVQSGLCLFDPDGREWSPMHLIADSTVPWASQWLAYYELWHLKGIWFGGGVGPESVAEAGRTPVHRSAY